MRTIQSRTIENPKLFKQQLLLWSNQFREVVFLDSNSYHQKYSSYDAVLAVDAFTSIKTDYENAFQDLYQYQSQTKDWLFGYLSYDLKNDTEALHSNNFDGLNFPDLFFFQPKKLFLIKGNDVEIHYLLMCDDEIESDFEEIVTITPIIHQNSTAHLKRKLPFQSFQNARTHSAWRHLRSQFLY